MDLKSGHGPIANSHEGFERSWLPDRIERLGRFLSPPFAVEAKGGATRREPHQVTWNFLPAPVGVTHNELAMFESPRTPVSGR